jgi:type I restriction enzyme S subunit
VSEGQWPIFALGELIETIEAGSSFRCRETPPEEGEVGVAKVSAVSWGRYDEQESKTCLDPSRVSEELLIRKGDFLISRANTVELVGACVIAEQVRKQVMLSDKTLRIQFKDPSLKPWVLHFLRSRAGREQIEALCTGNQESMRNISQRSLRMIELPLAPPEERQEILAFIDQQLSRAEAITSTLHAIQAKLKQARASILKAAVEGRLVPEASEFARPLDQSVQIYLSDTNSDAEPRDEKPGKRLSNIPPGWSSMKIRDLTEVVTSGSRGWAKYYSEDGPIFVRSQDINSGRLKLEGTVRVSIPRSAEGVRTKIKKGDILVIITGANVTISARVDRDPGEAYVSQHVALCRPKNKAIYHTYLHLWLMAPGAGKTQLDASAYGAGKPGLSLENIRSVSISFPPLVIQHQIASEVERRFSVLDQVGAAVNASLRRFDQLKQALLKRAFMR